MNEKIKEWKKNLLNQGRSNQLINMKETKRGTIKIIDSDLSDIYERLVDQNNKMSFAMPKTFIDDYNENEDGKDESREYIKGDVKTNRNPKELQACLKYIRGKAKIANEELGINILYIALGFLKWTDIEHSNMINNSPLILVPIVLSQENLFDPYKMQSLDNDIVLNPILKARLETDFGITLPEYESDEKGSVADFINTLNSYIENHDDWTITDDIYISLFSFLKINMYNDICRNEDRMLAHPIISALISRKSIEEEHVSIDLNNYELDNIHPRKLHQVVDADSSQQEAIVMFKKGCSFVMQGPPGTGKSQTITNIIAEALADKKKVLFVSEKAEALQVVYNRLKEVHLSDFCLPLHNIKTNKKDILKMLNSTLNLSKIEIGEENYSNLERLYIHRSNLNQYYKELHEPILPLNRTFYQIFGLCEKYDNDMFPDISFDIENIDKETMSSLNYKIEEIKRYSDTVGTNIEAFINSPWYGTKINHVTHELYVQIKENIGKLYPIISKLTPLMQNLYDNVGLLSMPKIDDVQIWDRIYECIKAAYPIPTGWFSYTEVEMNEFINKFNEYKNLKLYKAEISQRFTKNVFDIEFEKHIINLNAAFKKLSFYDESQKAFTQDNVYANCKILSNVTNNILHVIDFIVENDIYTKIGVNIPENIDGLNKFITVLYLCSSNIKPLASWFDEKSMSQLKEMIPKMQSDWNEYDKLHDNIIAIYNDEILNLDIEHLIKSFGTEYNSYLKRIFNSNYKNDKKLVSAFLRNNGFKLNYQFIVDSLSNLKKLKDMRLLITQKENILVSLLGNKYEGMATNWESINKQIGLFEQLILLIHDLGGMNKSLQRKLIDNNFESVDLIKIMDDFYNYDFKDSLEKFGNIIKNPLLNNISLEKYVDSLYDFMNTVNYFINEFDIINKNYIIPISTYKDFMADNVLLGKYYKIANSMSSTDQILKKNFSDYCGYDTDWKQIIDKLNNVLSYWGIKELGISQKKKISEDFDNFESCYSQIKELVNLCETSYNEFCALFEDDCNISSLPLIELKKKLGRCYKELLPLRDWVDYQNIMKELKNLGLSNFIQKIEQNHIELNIDIENISGVYVKHFYKLWIDRFIESKPAINQFRSDFFEKETKEFCNLDKLQMEIARMRIRASLIDSIPNMNSSAVYTGEMHILNRELNKSRKIMPMRKLFKQIPSLLMTLKPCLMMSPLSVSVFLDSDIYKFDVVIFDEASQVKTEDAIGAIMRGKQLIITGDKKQLPPSSFFDKTEMGNSFDDDDDDENDYESILEEISSVLNNEVWLRWHYRSRNEDLIAFSNNKFYDGNLITFPSNKERSKDNGVEYIPVHNAFYDSNHKRNINEAERVANLVFEHFSNWPERSLGVITFSLSQKETIENEINKILSRKPQFKPFFSEEKDDKFFIKNLENVQGDERDTIIFSICYARDINGRFNNFFGPLNKVGGERRLNVAITRAKYNVKLVGSINYTDITAPSVGAQLLRSYIDYAQNGIGAIMTQQEDPNAQVESNFEQSVLDFLESKNYQVAKQVGCSGYRIDLAVKHPVLSGTYVVGIECDGATYHSSRCARERDRLRQYVLEEMGWKIYRIWSRDWNFDPYTQRCKLVDYINKCISNFDSTGKRSIVHQYIDTNNEIPVKIIPNQNFSSDLGDQFKSYEKYQYGEKDYFSTIPMIINRIVDMEQPIHFHILCERLLPAFQNRKVTNRITNAVNDNIDGMSERLEKKYMKNSSDYFVTKKNFKTDFFRKSIDGEQRNIEQISPDEMFIVMKVVINKSFSIEKMELYRIVSKLLGFSQVGLKMRNDFNKIVDLGIKMNIFKEYDGEKIMLV